MSAVSLLFSEKKSSFPTYDRITENELFAANRLDLPFPESERIHSGWKEVETKMLGWLDRFKLATHPRKREEIIKAKYSEFVCRAYPDVDSVDLLTTIGCFGLWLFIYDDCIEELKDIDDVLHLHQKIESAMVQKINETERNPLIQSFSDLFEELRNTARPSWLLRFTEEIKAYCNGTLWEANHRLRGEIPSLESYLIKRMDTSGTLIMFSLIDVLPKDLLPDSVFSNPNFQSFRKCCANLVNYENDIRSFPKEFNQGEFFNLVMVIKNEKQCPIATAMQKACEYYHQESFSYRINKGKICMQFAQHTDVTKNNVERMESWIAGYYYWSKRTSRYRAENLRAKL